MSLIPVIGNDQLRIDQSLDERKCILEIRAPKNKNTRRKKIQEAFNEVKDHAEESELNYKIAKHELKKLLRRLQGQELTNCFDLPGKRTKEIAKIDLQRHGKAEFIPSSLPSIS